MLNFKDKTGQIIFKENTTKTKEFSKCLLSNKPLKDQALDWMNVLVAQCNKAFPKIRIRAKNLKKSKASNLIDKRNTLLRTENKDSEEVRKLTEEISIILEEEGKSKAYKFQKFCDKGNTLNVTEMWKLKKQIWPKKKSALPVAKRNYKGRLLSAPSDIRHLLLTEYKERLRERPCLPGLQKSRTLRQKLLKTKLDLSKKNKSEPFNMEDLDKVLTNIKSGKSRDPMGISREIFKPSIIGQDLKESLLKLCNSIKEEGQVPEFMCKTTISTIPKKGPRTELKNERGIFLVNSVRCILMRLLFNSESHMIDSNMSDSNIGGRKDKSCINHIWVLNSIIHEQNNLKSGSPVLFQQYDF